MNPNKLEWYRMRRSTTICEWQTQTVLQIKGTFQRFVPAPFCLQEHIPAACRQHQAHLKHVITASPVLEGEKTQVHRVALRANELTQLLHRVPNVSWKQSTSDT